MMNEYPALEAPAPPAADESLPAYAIRILGFVARTGITATVSDRDLQLADHCYAIAIGHPEILPVAVDTLSRARHQILAAIKGRTVPAPVAALPGLPPDRIIPGGRLSPLQPAPVTRPPAGALAYAGASDRADRDLGF